MSDLNYIELTFGKGHYTQMKLENFRLFWILAFIIFQGDNAFNLHAPMPTDIQANGEAFKIETASSFKLLKGVYDVRDIESTPRQAAATTTMHENAKFVKGIFNVTEIEAAAKTAKGFGTDAKQYKIESFGSFPSNSNVFYQGLYLFECEFKTICKEGNLMTFK